MADWQRLAAWPLLAAYLVALVRFVCSSRKRAGFAAPNRYRRWTVRQWLVFALPSLAGLALIGRLGALATMPIEFAPLSSTLPITTGADLPPLLAGAGGGVLVGALATWALARWRRSRRGDVAKDPFLLGNIAALLPRHRGELGWAALLSVSAGICEEIAFRLLLPLLLAIVTGSALFAMVGATLIFGAVHLYQGWVGVAATTLVGALLAGVYLASGALWAAMLVHAVIDLNGLVLRPLLAGLWRRDAEALS